MSHGFVWATDSRRVDAGRARLVSWGCGIAAYAESLQFSRLTKPAATGKEWFIADLRSD